MFVLDVDRMDLHVDVQAERALVRFARANLSDESTLEKWGRHRWMFLLDCARERVMASHAQTEEVAVA